MKTISAVSTTSLAAVDAAEAPGLVARITEYFMPVGYHCSVNELRQARIIVRTTLLMTLFCLNFFGLSLWGNFVPGKYILLVAPVVFMVVVLGFQQRLYSHTALGYLSLFNGFFTVLLNSIYQGGYYAAATTYMVIWPVAGSFLLGRRGGWIMFWFSLGSIIILWQIQQMHLSLPYPIDPAKYQFWSLDILVGLTLVMLTFSLIFDEINTTTLRLLNQQNDLLSLRTQQVEESIAHLKATQQQLILREKMASLGELTAGIAHEIQNPLNFVTNFSEVSIELLEELKVEQAKAKRDAGLEAELMDDLHQNLTKIHRHGQQAAGIVRGMLEHSRQSTGECTPTDLSALCEEYLHLAYQSLQTKNKSFNAALETDFAPGLPRVEAVAGDLGRVLLNLFSNAFYAVQQRQHTGEPGYVPTIRVSTRQVGRQVEIRVADNGTGIPADVQTKIFQPFFTTKPTGEGTGLGLSISHDIVVQGHGGTLSAASHEGEGSTFSLLLPSPATQ